MISHPEEPLSASSLRDSERPDEHSHPWTVGELLRWTEEFFGRLELPTPRLDAELLLAHAMGTSRLELYMGYGQVVQAEERAAFRQLVERRRRHEPVAYLIGSREFYSLTLEVGPGVLIPRPETEVLVDRVLAALRERIEEAVAPDGAGNPQRTVGEGLRLLDVGTGCGDIAIALAVQLPGARVTAVDLSPEALEVARRNACVHGVEPRIDFRQGDLLEALDVPEATVAPFDAVVSNPPYIAVDEYPHLMRDVKTSSPPWRFVTARGVTAWDSIARWRRLRSNTCDRVVCAVEVGATQAAQVRELLRRAGWEEIASVADYAGIERVVLAHRPIAG